MVDLTRKHGSSPQVRCMIPGNPRTRMKKKKKSENFLVFLLEVTMGQQKRVALTLLWVNITLGQHYYGF